MEMTTEENNNMIIVYYHDDLDGQCSAAIAQRRMPEANDRDMVLVPMQYGYDAQFVQSLVKPNDTVVILDFSLTEEDMEFVDKQADRVVWCDHHRTSIEQFGEKYKHWDGIRKEGRAGCELTWEYFTTTGPADSEAETPELPLAVHYSGRYDVWDHSDPNTVVFNYGMEMLDTDPRSPDSKAMWDDLLTVTHLSEDSAPQNWSAIDQVINLGLVAKTYHDNQVDQLVKKNTWLAEWEGAKWIVVNNHMKSSLDFESLAPAEVCDGIVWFTFDGLRNKWKYSLRAVDKKLNVATIAEKFGGGGHPDAAGFAVTNEPIYDLNVAITPDRVDAPAPEVSE